MAFDLGFNFRGTAGYVTDPAYGVPVLGEAYPHTYTAANGYSMNGGWTAAPSGSIDRASSNDPRIAGIQYKENGFGERFFQADLSSGSAPGAGDYTADLALGDTFANKQAFKLYDDTSVLIDGTNGGAGYSTEAGHYIDATLTDVTASTTWTGTTVSKTFATTTAKVGIAAADAGFSLSTTIAHFRLTLEGGAAADVRQEHIGFGIGRGILIGR